MKVLLLLTLLAVIAAFATAASADKVTLNSQGILEVAGKPYFPVGIYSARAKSGSDHDAVLKEVREAGFNTTVFYAYTVPEVMSLLDAAARNGIKAFVYPTIPFSCRTKELTNKEVVRDVKVRMNHPALLGWYLVDEPEGIGKAESNPVLDLKELVKKTDPNHPTSLVVMNPRPAAAYFNCADIIWTDPYPIPHASITMVSDWVSTAVDIAGASKPVWAVPQAFDWSVWNNGKIDKEHRPTPEEERCMTYLALVHGAKGILFWTHTGSKYYIPDYPDHWAAVKKIAGELRDLSPVLLTPTLPTPAMEPSDAPVDTMMKVSGGSIYIFAVNHDRSAHKVTFNVPKSAQADVRVLFEKRSVTVDGDSWTDNFAPLEAHVYKLPVRSR